MKITQPVKFGAWILIFLNLLMSFGSIWVFMRMAPAIETIIDQNQVSLQACEEMLAALLMKHQYEDGAPSKAEVFHRALSRAVNNITENEEPIALNAISKSYLNAFEGDAEDLQRTVEAILRLGEINRSAMIVADKRAQQLGAAGAWGVVFMATIVFLIGMLFLRSLRKNLSEPLEEINLVVSAFRRGDTMRRCTAKNPSRNIKQVFDNVNDLLDKQCCRRQSHDCPPKETTQE